MTTNDGNVTTPSIMDAWRTVEPEVIVQALRIGEHVSDLLTGAARLVQRARWNVDSTIEDAYIRCQTILDRLTSETDRLTPILMLLRAAKARSWLLVLGDVKRASTLNRVINDIDAERRRWLRAVDDPFS